MVLVGLIIGLVSMNVFGMSADTLLYCFLIDEEINKGLMVRNSSPLANVFKSNSMKKINAILMWY